MSNPTHYYYAAYPYYLPHEILAFTSESYRDKWVDCKSDFDIATRRGEEPECRIAITEDQAIRMIGLPTLMNDEMYIEDDFDDQIKVVSRPEGKQILAGML